MCSLTRRFVDLVGILRFGNEYAYIAQLVKKLVLLESLPEFNFEAPEQYMTSTALVLKMCLLQ